MAEIRRCAQCNFENPSGQIYCIKCGRFLRKNSDNIQETPTIWTVPAKPVAGISHPSENDVKQLNDYEVVICPQCEQVIKTQGGVLPMTCGSCGYFFQMGVDRIISYSEYLRRKQAGRRGAGENSDKIDTDQNTSDDTEKNQKKRRDDNTKLRLIVRSDPTILPQEINPLGDIVGLNGTVLKQLKINSQVKINRVPTGWYIEVLEGDCVVEGVHMNKRVQRKLSNGNFITFGKHQIVVEITG